MDFAWLTGLVTAIGGTTAVVITALGAYQQKTATRSEDRGTLTAIWDADRVVSPDDVGRRILDLFPIRVRRRMAELFTTDDEGATDAKDHADA